MKNLNDVDLQVLDPQPPIIHQRCCDCGWALPDATLDWDGEIKVDFVVTIICPHCLKLWELRPNYNEIVS